jgi:hypothetical protein
VCSGPAGCGVAMMRTKVGGMCVCVLLKCWLQQPVGGIVCCIEESVCCVESVFVKVISSCQAKVEVMKKVKAASIPMSRVSLCANLQDIPRESKSLWYFGRADRRLLLCHS